MEKIAFARVLRDCKHNDEIKAAGGKRGLIYDFMVIIDGEHRATWRKDAAGRGYILRTPNADPLRMQISNGLASHKRVFKQAKFETAIREALDASLIPRRDKNEASRVHIVEAADRFEREVWRLSTMERCGGRFACGGQGDAGDVRQPQVRRRASKCNLANEGSDQDGGRQVISKCET